MGEGNGEAFKGDEKTLKADGEALRGRHVRMMEHVEVRWGALKGGREALKDAEEALSDDGGVVKGDWDVLKGDGEALDGDEKAIKSR